MRSRWTVSRGLTRAAAATNESSSPRRENRMQLFTSSQNRGFGLAITLCDPGPSSLGRPTSSSIHYREAVRACSTRSPRAPSRPVLAESESSRSTCLFRPREAADWCCGRRNLFEEAPHEEAHQPSGNGSNCSRPSLSFAGERTTGSSGREKSRCTLATGLCDRQRWYLAKLCRSFRAVGQAIAHRCVADRSSFFRMLRLLRVSGIAKRT